MWWQRSLAVLSVILFVLHVVKADSVSLERAPTVVETVSAVRVALSAKRL